MRPSPNEAVTDLIDLMNNDIYAKVTSAAVHALGKIGPQAEAAIPHLVEIAAGTDNAIFLQRQRAVSRIKKSALWRSIFLREESKRPWSYPRLDISNFPGMEVTIACLRRDAAIAVLQVTSGAEYVNVAVANLRELWSNRFANLNDDYLLRNLTLETFNRVKSMM